MVYIDIPGLPKAFNVNYRPPRVSLFPLSYRDRAYLRSIHRDVLRQTATVTKPSEGGTTVIIPPESEKKVEQKADKATKSSQTTETYCSHTCSHHPYESKKSDEKKSNKNQEPKAKGSKKNKKNDDCQKYVNDDSNDSDNDDDDKRQSSKDRVAVLHVKGRKHSKPYNSSYKMPDSLKSFLPYPFISPNANDFWANSNFQRPFPEPPLLDKDNPTGWNLDHKLEAARRADERYLWSRLSEQEENCQKAAFQWLVERDNQRQVKLSQATHDLGGLSLDPSVGRQPPGLLTGFYGVQNHQNLYSNTNGNFGSLPINGASLQAFTDQYGNIRLGDGTMIALGGQYTDNQRHQAVPNFQQQQHQSGPQMWPNSQQSFQHSNQGPQSNWQNPDKTSHNQNWENFSHQNPGAFNGHHGNQNVRNHNDQTKTSGNGGWPEPNYKHGQNNTSGANTRQPDSRWNPQHKKKHNAGQNKNNWSSGQKHSPQKSDSNNHGNGDNGSAWGVGNDENSKLNDFFEPVNHKRGHSRSNQQQNCSYEFDDSASQDLRNHPFFSENAPPPNTIATGPTMSGAKRKSGRHHEESIKW